MNEDIAMLKEISDRLIAGTNLDFKRYLFSNIDWRNRFVCLKGAKGTGKTTILRQHIKEQFGLTDSVFYLSFDHLWFTNHSALDLVDTLQKNGVTHLFIDEVHHLEHWATVIKNIYDFYPDMHVAYSGSSILRLDRREGDMSRRQLCYDLKGLSFREFLSFEGVKSVAPVSLEDLLANHREIAAEIEEKIPELTERIERWVEEHITDVQQRQHLDIDMEVKFNDVTPRLYKSLRVLSPYGPGNQKPMFVVRRIKDQGRSRLVGKEQEHIRLELVDPVTNFTHNGIAFNQASKFELVKSGKPFDIVFTIEENTFSKNNIQLLVKDIRESESNNIAAVLSLLIRNTKDDADVIGGMTTNPEM